jgi:hypothetical protein
MRWRRFEKPGGVFAGIVEDFLGPRTTQMPVDRLPQQNGFPPDRLLALDALRREFAPSRSMTLPLLNMALPLLKLLMC